PADPAVQGEALRVRGSRAGVAATRLRHRAPGTAGHPGHRMPHPLARRRRGTLTRGRSAHTGRGAGNDRATTTYPARWPPHPTPTARARSATTRTAGRNRQPARPWPPTPGGALHRPRRMPAATTAVARSHDPDSPGV